MNRTRLMLGVLIIVGSLLISMGLTTPELGALRSMPIGAGLVLFGFGVAGVGALWKDDEV